MSVDRRSDMRSCAVSSMPVYHSILIYRTASRISQDRSSIRAVRVSVIAAVRARIFEQRIDRMPTVLTSSDIPHTLRQTMRSLIGGDSPWTSTASTAAKPASTKPPKTRRRPPAAATIERPGAGNRRLPARHRCPQAERHRHDLRPARHPDHRPHAQAAGRGPARDLVPPRAERRATPPRSPAS